MKGVKKLLVFLSISFIFLFLGCNKENNSLVKQFGINSYYFLGLNELKENNQEEAIRMFQKGIRKSDDFFARKCMEEITFLGNPSQRVSMALHFAEKYKDTDAVLRAVQELTTIEDYDKIISITSKYPCDYNSELTKLKLNAVVNKQRKDFAGEIEDWFLHQPITKHHQSFYNKYFDTFINQSLSSETLRFIKLRMTVYNADYIQAYKILSSMMSIQINLEEWLANLSPILLSDIGKIFLYGNTNYLYNAKICDTAKNIAKENGNNLNQFYLNFYSGRLYDKSTSANIENALERFENAILCATDAQKKDNALWYYLSTSLKKSTEQAIKGLEKYISEINDPLYFSDFFETICQRTFTVGDWDSFYSIYLITKDKLDSDTFSRYSYLVGRLFQLGLIKQNTGTKTQEIARQYFSSAYKEGGTLYYRLLSAFQLNLSEEEIKQTIYNAKLLENFERNKNIEQLLDGYIFFNLPEKIYHEWKLNYKHIGLETETKASFFLSKQSEQKYVTQALRIISNSIHHADSQPDESTYKMIFPRYFTQEIAEYCSEFGLNDYIFLALVRSESFFEPIANSNKGAVGLTQIMPGTGADIARRLKVKEYDLADSATNLRFGAYYLSHLQRRLNGSILEALFSYNAGLKRFENWKAILPNLPQDILLELLPYAETREYGRKLTTASTMYGTLYYGKTHAEVIREMLEFN